MLRNLSQEGRDKLIEIGIIFALNILFMLLLTPILWLLGRLPLALQLAAGFAILWLMVTLSTIVADVIRYIGSIDPDRHFNRFIAVNLLLSALLIAGWSAFTALAVRDAAAAASIGLAVTLFLTGLLSAFAAYVIVGSFYSGTIYQLSNLVLAPLFYLLFFIWPAAARLLFGWFISLFSSAL